MPRLVALKEHKYDSVIRKPGGPSYEATDKHAFILKRLGRAADAPTDAPVRGQAPRVAAPTDVSLPAPEGPSVMGVSEASADIPPAFRRRYQRRDMKAQE